eukprot:3016373-Pleurochrysis_carterae.AAC.1
MASPRASRRALAAAARAPPCASAAARAHRAARSTTRPTRAAARARRRGRARAPLAGAARANPTACAAARAAVTRCAARRPAGAPARRRDGKPRLTTSRAVSNKSAPSLIAKLCRRQLLGYPTLTTSSTLLYTCRSEWYRSKTRVPRSPRGRDRPYNGVRGGLCQTKHAHAVLRFDSAHQAARTLRSASTHARATRSEGPARLGRLLLQRALSHDVVAPGEPAALQQPRRAAPEQQQLLHLEEAAEMLAVVANVDLSLRRKERRSVSHAKQRPGDEQTVRASAWALQASNAVRMAG